MNPRIEKIRQLLSELEAEGASAPRGDAGFSALELPDIIGEIVDDLQPILTAYDAAFYWFLFRHSIAKDGDPQIRVSRSTLRRAVVKSSYTDAAENMISFGKVQETLRSLEEIGAIKKVGEPNRQGTLYRVLIPDEIEACRRFRAERTAEESALFPTANTNHHKTRLQVFERDGYQCAKCGKQLTRFTATMDYVKSPEDGGVESSENLVTRCADCNTRGRKKGLVNAG
ncbi:MAG TPA: HNH endonuclease [Terracidiphilus sp.]